MRKRWTLQKALPLIAVAGAVIVLVCLAVGTGSRARLLSDDGETRRAVERLADELTALAPNAADEPAFQDALKRAQGAPYVATVWLFTPDGEVLAGSMAIQPGDTVEERATAETRRVLGIVPADALDTEERTLLLAASAMQAEGEHNDVYRHMLRPVRNSQGQLVALVGLTYDVSPAVGTPPSLGWTATLLGALLGLALYWLSLPLWTWLDARARGERAWVWAAFVLVGNLVALLAYLLARPPRPTAAEPT